MAESFANLLKRIRACRLCEAALQHPPRPILAAHPRARLLIIGQAPGARVHASGIPWQDASGRLLRTWLGLDETTFYDPARVALMPMGFCYPGAGKSGDLPPRPECAPAWHGAVRAGLPAVELTLLIGDYAQRYYLGERAKPTLTENVRAFREHLPAFLLLPHPSPRNRHWLSRNPWFATEVLPVLRERVRKMGFH